MNDESCRTEPLGIEWEFKDGEPALVAHLPGRRHRGDWELWDLLSADLGDLTPLQRSIVRAYLQVVTANLDETEPTQRGASCG